ncbi:efflux RND transporter periplasmic adaptor subunit [Patescibacteria group bacterium]
MKRAVLTTIIAFTLILPQAGCKTEEKSSVQHNAPKQALTHTLKSESVEVTVSLTGTLQADKKTLVSTKSSGRVASLYFDVGDEVKAGDLLGALSGDESLINLDTARLDETNAELVYNSQKKLMEEQIESAKKTLERAETSLDAAKKSTLDTKSTTSEQSDLAQKSVEQAETALEIAENAAAQRLSSLYDTTDSTIRSAVIAAANAHSYGENLLEVNETRANSYYDKYEKYFGVLDSQTKRDAQSVLKVSYGLYKEIEGLMDETGSMDNEEKIKYLEDALEMLEVTQDMLNKAYIMLNNSISAIDLPESSLQALRQEALLHSQTVESAILSASGDMKVGTKGWLSTYDEIITQNNSEINAAQSQLLTAKQQLNQADAGGYQYVSSAESQVSIIEKDVEQARIALLATEAQKENVLRQLERELSVVKGTMQLSEVVLGNTQVIAPFDGILTSKYVEEGRVVAAGQPIYELSNISGFKIETDLPDTYISKLETGLLAEVSIDGVGGTFEATLTRIDPNVNPVNHKLGIELTLKEVPSNAKIGQFARIVLKLPEETAYFVPTHFIYRDFEGPYVVLDNNEQQVVTTGSEKDGLVRIWWPEIEENMVIKR